MDAVPTFAWKASNEHKNQEVNTLRVWLKTIRRYQYYDIRVKYRWINNNSLRDQQGQHNDLADSHETEIDDYFVGMSNIRILNFLYDVSGSLRIKQQAVHVNVHSTPYAYSN